MDMIELLLIELVIVVAVGLGILLREFRKLPAPAPASAPEPAPEPALAAPAPAPALDTRGPLIALQVNGEIEELVSVDSYLDKETEELELVFPKEWAYLAVDISLDPAIRFGYKKFGKNKLQDWRFFRRFYSDSDNLAEQPLNKHWLENFFSQPVEILRVSIGQFCYMTKDAYVDPVRGAFLPVLKVIYILPDGFYSYRTLEFFYLEHWWREEISQV